MPGRKERGERSQISLGPSNQALDEDRAEDYTPKTKGSRMKRPNQAPPMPRMDEDAAAEDIAMHFDYEHPEEAEVGVERKKQENQYREKITRQHERWQQQRAGATHKAVQDLPFVRAAKHLKCSNFIADLQDGINECWMLHPCCCGTGDDGTKSFDSSCLTPVPQVKHEKRSTVYYGNQFSGPLCSLDLPLWHCNKCKEKVKPHPLTFGCWPSTPHTPTFWIDVDVLEQYRMLGPAPKAGTSSQVFVASIKRVHERWGLCAVEDMSHLFLSSFMEYFRATHSISSLDSNGLDVAPAAKDETGKSIETVTSCIFCNPSLPYSPPRSVSQSHRRFHASLSLDATTKCCHFTSLGQAQAHLQHSIHRFIGPINYRVQELKAQGNFTLDHTVGRDRTIEEARGEESSEARTLRSCSASTTLHCSRQDSHVSPSLPVDRYGLFGGVCCHGVPLRSIFIDMTQPENFSMYIMAIEALVKSLGQFLQQDVTLDIYIDFGCRITPTWKEFLEKIDCWYRLEWWIEELLENIKVAQSKESEPTIHASFRGLMKRHALSHLGSGRWFLLQTEAERFSPLLTRVKGMKKMYVQKLESMI